MSTHQRYLGWLPLEIQLIHNEIDELERVTEGSGEEDLEDLRRKHSDVQSRYGQTIQNVESFKDDTEKWREYHSETEDRLKRIEERLHRK